MSDPPPGRVPPTAAWLAEQERKQEAYVARRRAWTRALERAAAPDAEEVSASPRAASPTGDADPKPARRARGKVHDPRQGRFEF